MGNIPQQKRAALATEPSSYQENSTIPLRIVQTGIIGTAQDTEEST